MTAAVMIGTDETRWRTMLELFGQPEMFEVCTPVAVCADADAAMAVRQADYRHVACVVAADGAAIQAGRINVMTEAPQGVPVVDADGLRHAVMPMVVSDRLRLALLGDGDEPVAQGRLLHRTLRRDFRVAMPRLALAAGDTMEERTLLRQASKQLEEAGINAFVTNADELAAEDVAEQFDGILARRTDKALQAFSTQAGRAIYGLSAGADIVTVIPLKASAETEADALRRAIFAAIDIRRHREDYDRPLANPLKKLYHERRDESEKVRFSVPKSKPQEPTKEPTV